MKKKTANSTVNYDAEVVSDACSIHFTKVTNAAGRTLYGKIMKDDAEVGSVSYDEKGGYLITSLKPYASLTADEVDTIYLKVPGCVREALGDE